LLIGATALHLGFGIVTLNIRHFQAIPVDLTMFSTDVQAGGPSSVFSRERPDLFRCYPGRIFRQIDNIDAIDHTHGPDRADSPTQQFGYRLSKPYGTALGILPHRRYDIIFKINCCPHE